MTTTKRRLTTEAVELDGLFLLGYSIDCSENYGDDSSVREKNGTTNLSKRSRTLFP